MNMHAKDEIILKELQDGVITISNGGALQSANNAARKMLSLKDSDIGEKLIVSLLKDEKNEAFVQGLLDAVYQKGIVQKSTVGFWDGEQDKILEISSSYPEDLKELIVVMTDVTEREAEKKERRTREIIVFVVMLFACVSVILYGALQYFLPEVDYEKYTLLLEVLWAIGFIAISWKIGFGWKDLNIRKPSKKVILFGITAGLTGGALLAGFKLFLIKSGLYTFKYSFLSWKDFHPLYIGTVAAQEIMSRSLMQNLTAKLFSGKYKHVLAVVTSSLVFSTLHIAFGFPMMAGAMLLLSVFGIYYSKTGDIWGLILVHFIVGNSYFIMFPDWFA